MTIKIFGHYCPDTDATASSIIYSWVQNNLKKQTTTPYVLSEPNSEAKFVLNYWNQTTPEILEKVTAEDKVIIVDTNNPEELPEGLKDAEILEILDHHKLYGGLKTKSPINITTRNLGSTATVIFSQLFEEEIKALPRDIKGLVLSCVLSDTLEFRSPTTTQTDIDMAQYLAEDLNINLNEYATKMFKAKSDISDFSDADIIKADSKKVEHNGKTYRVGVFETTSPQSVLDRKESIMQAMNKVCDEEKLELALLFVVDILNESSTLLIPNEATKTIAENSFNVKVNTNTIELPGVVSRKKQIIPVLKFN